MCLQSPLIEYLEAPEIAQDKAFSVYLVGVQGLLSCQPSFLH